MFDNDAESDFEQETGLFPFNDNTNLVSGKSTQAIFRNNPSIAR